MQQTPSLSALKEIMPSAVIPVNLLPYLLILLLLLLLMGLWIFNRIKKRMPRPTPQTRALERLKQLDLEGEISREMLYRFTLNAKCYLDGKKNQEFEAIEQRLLPHKYQIHTPQPDLETLQKMRIFIRKLA